MTMQWTHWYERRCTRLAKMFMFILVLYSVHLIFWVWRVADPDLLESAFIWFSGFAWLLIRIHLDPLSFDFLCLKGCWSGSIWIRLHLTFWVCSVADPDLLWSDFIWFSGFAWLLIRIYLGVQGFYSLSTWIRFLLTFWVCRVADTDPLGSTFIWFSGSSCAFYNCNLYVIRGSAKHFPNGRHWTGTGVMDNLLCFISADTEIHIFLFILLAINSFSSLISNGQTCHCPI